MDEIPNLCGDNYQKALSSALRILTVRDHSKYELIHKLKQRGFIPDAIDKAVSECERLDYLNDERTSRLYVRQLIMKGYGERRIRLEVNKKGLRGEAIQRILSEILADTAEQEVAERIFTKNIKRFEREKNPLKRRDKIYRFLHARGFAPDTIRKLIGPR